MTVTAHTSGEVLREENAPVVSLDGLTVTTHDGTELVSSVSFEIGTGERLGLIGESGSGKSLTSIAISGLLPAGLRPSGSLLLGCTQVVGANEQVLRPLRGPVTAVVFQEPLTALDPLMRVGKQIAEPLTRHLGLRGAALRAAVAAALAEVALPDDRVARSFPHQLSGGQRQRVALAIALAGRPKLLIADEPTTALDVTVQREMLSLIDRLVRERGMALLFISHDLAVVSQMVDRIVVMQRGRTVETGTPTEVIGNPQHPYTQELVASARALDAALDGEQPAGLPPLETVTPAESNDEEGRA